LTDKVNNKVRDTAAANKSYKTYAVL
jgi:hypothetical protein